MNIDRQSLRWLHLHVGLQTRSLLYSCRASVECLMTAVDAEPPRRPAESRAQGVHRFLGRLHEVLDGVDAERLWALSPAELGECLGEAYAAVARLEELKLALVAQADS